MHVRTHTRTYSLVPRPSPAPVLIACSMQNWASKRSKTGAGEGLGTRLRVRALSEELGNNQNCEEVAGRESDDEDDTADQEEPPKLKSYKEAVVALEEVSRFLEFKGHGDEVLSIGNLHNWQVCESKTCISKTDNTTWLFHSLTNNDHHMYKLYFC